MSRWTLLPTGATQANLQVGWFALLFRSKVKRARHPAKLVIGVSAQQWCDTPLPCHFAFRQPPPTSPGNAKVLGRSHSPHPLDWAFQPRIK